MLQLCAVVLQDIHNSASTALAVAQLANAMVIASPAAANAATLLTIAANCTAIAAAATAAMDPVPARPWPRQPLHGGGSMNGGPYYLRTDLTDVQKIASMPPMLKKFYDLYGQAGSSIQPTKLWAQPGVNWTVAVAFTTMLDYIGNVLDGDDLLDAQGNYIPGSVAITTPPTRMGANAAPSIHQHITSDHSKVAKRVPRYPGTGRFKYISHDHKNYVILTISSKPKIQIRATEVILWACYGPPPACFANRDPVCAHVCEVRRR